MGYLAAGAASVLYLRWTPGPGGQLQGSAQLANASEETTGSEGQAVVVPIAAGASGARPAAPTPARNPRREIGLMHALMVVLPVPERTAGQRARYGSVNAAGPGGHEDPPDRHTNAAMQSV